MGSWRRQWLFGLLPISILGLVLWSWTAPSAPEGSYVRLVGAWEAQADGTTSWKPITLPGEFGAQGLPAADVTLRRVVVLPPLMRGVPLRFTTGYVHTGTLTVRANGVGIGGRGTRSTGFLGSDSELTSYYVDPSLTSSGEVTLELHVHSDDVVQGGVLDPQLLLGRDDVLQAWVFRSSSLRTFLQSGAVLALAFLGGLVLVLWWLQGARARKDLFAGTLGLVGSSAAYLVGMSGLFIGSLVPGRMVTGFTLLAIFALGLAIPEFVESYYLGRVTWLRRLNRVICGGSLLFGAVGLVLSIELMTRYYLVFVNWLFVLVAESIFISVRDALKRGSRFGPVVTVSVVLTALAGVNDLLADLGLTYAPRLFGMGLFNLAIASAVVVIGEFLGLAEENRVLSASLSTRNAELSKALAAATESARVKAEFLASTSHELRTPLNAIINIPQGLLEGIVESRRVQCTRCRSLFELEPGESAQLAAVCPECGAATEGAESAWALELEPRSTQRLLKSVVGSGQHLLAVVNDILDFSKLEASRMVLHRELVNVNELLENVRETLGPVAERAGVRLVVSALTVDVRLELDRVKLSQVLINLLSNAIKFSDGKGTVTLAAESSPGGLALSVRDEGIGIAPEHQGLIFEGFRQVEGGSTRRFGGTGLGLAISRKLVELHGARLELHSALGQGSTFTVQLPPEPGAVAEVSGGSRLVLVIDDEPTAVDAAAAALTPLGYTVRGVRDPRQALEEIRRQAPVMVILDVMMPRLSGIDVLKQLKEDAQLRAVPVLVASAYPDNREAVELLGARFLSKPWTPEELTRKMVDLAAPVRKSGGLTTS